MKRLVVTILTLLVLSSCSDNKTEQQKVMSYLRSKSADQRAYLHTRMQPTHGIAVIVDEYWRSEGVYRAMFDRIAAGEKTQVLIMLKVAGNGAGLATCKVQILNSELSPVRKFCAPLWGTEGMHLISKVEDFEWEYPDDLVVSSDGQNASCTGLSDAFALIALIQEQR